MRRWGLGMKKKKDKVDHHSPEKLKDDNEPKTPVPRQQQQKQQQQQQQQEVVVPSTTTASTTPTSTTTSYLWHVQIQSEAKWELLPNIMACISSLKLHVLDHRTWNAPPSPNSPTNETIVFNEIYCQDKQETVSPTVSANVHDFEERRIEQITLALQLAIHQPPHPMARVNVQRWFPQKEKDEERDNNNQEISSSLPTTITTAVSQATKEEEVDPNETNDTIHELLKPTSQRRLRRKMKSTPAGFMGNNGLDMFGAPTIDNATTTNATASSRKSEGNKPKHRGCCYHKATIVLKCNDGHESENTNTKTTESSSFDVLLSDEVVDALKSGFNQYMGFKSRSLLCTMIQPDFDSTNNNDNVGMQLQGYIRNGNNNAKIQEVDESNTNDHDGEEDNITETMTDRSSV